MRIVEVARIAGVSTKAVRYYESLGLLAVTRGRNGYREYDESHVLLIREIQQLRGLGIRADQARPFLDCIVSGRPRGDDCAAPLATYREAIESLDDRVEELSKRRAAIVALLSAATLRAGPVASSRSHEHR